VALPKSCSASKSKFVCLFQFPEPNENSIREPKALTMNETGLIYRNIFIQKFFSKGVIWGYAPINNKTRKSDHQRVTWTKNDNKAVCIFAQPHRSCCGHCFDRRPQQHRSGPRALGKAGPRAATGDPRFRPTGVPRLTQLAIGAWNWGIYPQIWTREWEGPSLHIYTIHVKNLTQCNKKHINRFIVTN
jgi:hypothetical protein